MSSPTSTHINIGMYYIVYENKEVQAFGKVTTEKIVVLQSPKSATFSGTLDEVKDHVKENELSVPSRYLNTL